MFKIANIRFDSKRGVVVSYDGTEKTAKDFIEFYQDWSWNLGVIGTSYVCSPEHREEIDFVARSIEEIAEETRKIQSERAAFFNNK